MQLTRQYIQIVEKIVRTENGLFLARFAVKNFGGVFKARLIEMVEVPDQTVQSVFSNTTLFIEAPHVKQIITFVEPIHTKIVSPYLELSFFISSISPRAPNFK